jgi:predicted transcriptional regulator
MEVLWERGSATANEVRDALDDPLAYNSVLTMLRILEEKGHARHEEEGRAFRYFPRTARATASKFALGRMVKRLFRGSPSLLVTELVRSQKLSVDEMRAMREMLDDRLRDRGEK